MRNFNEILRKDVPYDNSKSHKKTEFHPLSRRYIFRRTTGGGESNWSPSPSRFRVNLSKFWQYTFFLFILPFCLISLFLCLTWMNNATLCLCLFKIYLGKCTFYCSFSYYTCYSKKKYSLKNLSAFTLTKYLKNIFAFYAMLLL